MPGLLRSQKEIGREVNRAPHHEQDRPGDHQPPPWLCRGSMTIPLGTTKVLVRVENSAQGKTMELFVTTPTRSWSWSTSSTGEPRI
jgi:hypothetical protein